MRAAWMLLHRGVDSDGHGAGHGTSSKKLPGMGGNAGPAYSSSGKFHRAESSGGGGGVLDIPGFPWYGGKHGVRAIDRFRKAHFERGAQSIKMSSESVVRTEDMTLDEMARELTADDASYLRWWAASAVDSNLKFLCVAGTSAFALERTLMMLQFTHGVFNRAGSGAPFRNTPEYRAGNIREKKWERQRDGAARHAVFLPGDLRLVDTRCYMAIDACALESVRLESLMYIPLHMRMPTSPLLLQAWARSWGTESEVRLHAISATINFFVQHMTQAHDSTMRWVHPIWSPAFALYDMLPEFLTLVRGHRNAHILSLLRESVLDGAHAKQHDSMGQTILAFILQKQHHILTRRMYNMLRTIFDKSYDIRVAHPIVAALFRYYKQCPTVAQLNSENSWVDFFLPSWDVLDLDSVHEKLRPRLSVEECRPHHFFYLLCFDTENFTEHLRDDLARSFSIDDYSAREGINVLHRPSFNFSNKVITADQVYTSEFRDYLKHCAIPRVDDGGGGGGGGVASAPRDYTRKKQFFSNDVRDALPLGNLHLVMSAVQHLSWNPPPPYSTVKSNPNLVHELMPPSSRDPRLDPDNMMSVVRMGNVLSFVTSETPYDMPVARTEYFCPTPEVPERRPFPRQPAAVSELDDDDGGGGGDGPKKQKQPPKTKQRGGRGYRPKTASLMPKPIGVGMAHRKPPFALADDEEEVLYMSEWLLSFPLKTRPSEASVGIAELDAFLLVRDPAYLEYREACGDPIMSQSMQRREFPKEGAEE